MKIPIIFLGTGQAIPTIKRNHTSILLEYKDENLLIDCGEGTQRQFRKLHLNPGKITRLLITHWHGDHVLGIPGLLQTLALNGYNKRLYIYGPQGTEYFMNKIMQMYVYEGKLDYVIKEIITGEVFETQDFKVEALPMEHRTKCLAYAFKEKDKIRIDKAKLKKLKIKGKIIGELAKGNDIEFEGKKIKAEDLTYEEKGKKIAFLFDTRLNENCFKIAENSDLLISEAAYTQEEENLAAEHLHLTAEQTAGIAKKSNCKKLVLAHLSQRYENREHLILKEAKKTFKNSLIAEDLTSLEV